MADTPFLKIDLDLLRGAGSQMRQGIISALRMIDKRTAYTPRVAINTPIWIDRLSQWENDTLGRDLRVAVISSSVFADDAQAGAAAQKTSVANALANQCRNRGMNADSESFFGTFGGGTVAAVMGFDSRQVFTGVTKVGSLKTQGGASINFDGTGAGTWALTPLKPFTKARVFYRNNTTGRQVTWACTDGAGGGADTSGTIASNGTVEVGEVTLDLGATGNVGAKTLTFTTASGYGNFDIYGVIFYNDAYANGRKGIQFLDMSFRGATSANLIDDGTGIADNGRIKILTKVAPDVILIEPGVVNDGNQSVPLSTSKANISSMHTLYLAIADTIFVTAPFSAGTSGLSSQQDKFNSQIFEVADAANAPVVDYRAEEGSWDNVKGFGTATPARGSLWHKNNDVHVSEGGKGHIARKSRYALGLH